MPEKHTESCMDCNLDLTDQPRGPCPACGSTKRDICVDVTEGVQIYESLETKIKDPTRRSKDKLRRHSHQGVFRGGDGNLVYKERDLDKTRDPAWYTEHVRDLRTGDVIRDCSEPLADHQDRGYAKFKINESGD